MATRWMNGRGWSRGELVQLERRLAVVEGALWTSQRRQRSDFIREAAIAIFAKGIDSEGVAFTPKTCWAAARELWDAKPEDY